MRWVLTLALLAVGCAGPLPPPVNPAAPCDAACANFSAVCPQGGPGCSRLCTEITDPAFRACLATAKSCDEGSSCDASH
jgi:hypothetical protein